jgi:hypothetical protein
MTGHDGADFVPEEDGMDETLRPTADRVRGVLDSGLMRPAFRDRLRREVVAAREAEIAAGTRRIGGAPPGARRPGGAVPGARRSAPAGRPTAPARPARARRWRPVLGMAVAAAAVVVAGAVLVVNGPPFVGRPRPARVSVLSNVDGVASGAPTAALRLTFSQPLDHTATVSALRLSPAAQVRSGWEGDTLTVTPLYGFAPNSAYVLTVDHAIARTAGGAPLAADVHVLFGTAPVAGREPSGNAGMGAALPLVRKQVAGADDGSEAVVVQGGTLLLTAAQAGPGTDNHQGLVRIGDGTATPLSTATDAICVSRSGRSVAFLNRTTTGTRVVFANGVGSPSSSVPVEVDQGSPLGWINDAEVSFVGAGRLKAVNREGRVRTLSDAAVDAARDTVEVAPGGRYAYLRPASGNGGKVVDLRDNAAHALPTSTGSPSFSADGATVAWFDSSGGTPRLAVAASGGGPVLTVKLPVQSGDQLSDLALSPDGYHFVYSVTAANHHAELRLSTLPDGRTVAASSDAVGQSPNWAASGRMFTILTGGAGSGHIDTVTVPEPATDRQAAPDGLAMAFANAQISADAGAQRSLAAADTALPTVPGITRAAVLWVLPAAGGTATARLRLTIDPRPDRPVAQQAEETLTLGPRPDGTLAVRAVSVEDLHPAPNAPQVLRLDTDASAGAVLLTFDSDLDPDSVPTAIGLSTADGRTFPGTASYDAATRTVTLRAASATTTSVVVRVDTGLRDVRGQRAAAGLRVAVDLGS